MTCQQHDIDPELSEDARAGLLRKDAEDMVLGAALVTVDECDVDEMSALQGPQAFQQGLYLQEMFDGKGPLTDAAHQSIIRIQQAITPYWKSASV